MRIAVRGFKEQTGFGNFGIFALPRQYGSVKFVRMHYKV